MTTLTGMREMVSEDEVQFFLKNGYLILRGVLGREELEALRGAMDRLMEGATEQVRQDPDYLYGLGHKTGKPVLKRIEYVIDKQDPCKVLAGQPFILRSVERIIGRDFIPTWDSMVMKLPSEGIIVPWHRDSGNDCVGDRPIFNVDYYLDEADLDTCLWVYPGSHKWEQDRVDAIVKQEGFSTEGATPVAMQPGDAIFHNILLVHGSPSNSAPKLRRVIYFEYRAAHVELELGPHRPEYIALKQRVLLGAIAQRSRAGYAKNETPFVYQPPEPFGLQAEATEPPPTWRYAHEEYWRA